MGSIFSCELSEVLQHVCSCLIGEVNYICNLEENLEALNKAMRLLRATRTDVLKKVQRQESEGLERLDIVQVWLTDVEEIQNQVCELLLSCTVELERLCLCGLCSQNLRLSYNYGKRVLEMLTTVKDLESNGDFGEVTGPPTIAVVVERPLQQMIVGQEKMLEKAWNRLMDDETGIMGLYGMGGVGKTTLLEQINNKFVGANVGKFVIWVVVSSDLRVEKIQEEIAVKLGFDREHWKRKEKSEKVTDLHTQMKKKKFVLLLDDIWSEVNLKEIGVPFPTRENGCKVIFTTRSREVCGHMGVDDPMEVECLDSNEAWELFRSKVGKITLESHPDILELACQVARKCRGLPLALNIIGKNMASKRTVQDWYQAIDTLASSAAGFPGMEDHIFLILKLSYDGLKNEHVKSCFQYCALFPEDFKIEKEKLVDYWICEGFIVEKQQDKKKARNQAYGIIGTLVQASLLIDEGNDGLYVKMHDVVREMALWIASDFGMHKERDIVQTGVGLLEVPTLENWSSVRRMSLMENEIRNIYDSPVCHGLTTLLFQNNRMENISGEFFKSMPKLVVLDVSHNNLDNGLPDEISELTSLRYLDLSYTCIKQLHAGLLELKRLIYLNLERTKLESISGISNLSSLRTLRLLHSKMSKDSNVMKELQLLEHLEEVTIEIGSSLVVDQLLNAPRVANSVRELHITNLQEDSVLKFPNMVVLRTLEMYGSKMGGIYIERRTAPWNKSPTTPSFPNLYRVFLSYCHGLKDLTWLLFAPNLTVLTVGISTQIEDIISKEKAASIVTGEEEGTIIPFPRLKHLQVYNLPKLKSIYWRSLHFPCLSRLHIARCPNLKKLPLDSGSGSSIAGEELVIHNNEQYWLDEVRWEDEATKERFLRSINPSL